MTDSGFERLHPGCRKNIFLEKDTFFYNCIIISYIFTFL
ncbi:hypothetical protein D1AOALGA4SA_4059 [Olavius algarvensis Delta 1 endosymbiont]|nr:hypothetical protein D1AOALGA4SA_4059 [Olavius algarvensis Delta 1 endosymbiont]